MKPRTIFLRLACVLVVMCGLFTLTVFAQSDAVVPATPTEQPGQSVWLMLYNAAGAALVSWAVQLFKKWRFATEHPQFIALIGAGILTLIPIVVQLPFAANGFTPIAVSFLTSFLAAIGVHESLNKRLGAGGRE